jgi:nicotinate-nucleotide pyrophosphorylase (carboxylating)
MKNFIFLSLCQNQFQLYTYVVWISPKWTFIKNAFAEDVGDDHLTLSIPNTQEGMVSEDMLDGSLQALLKVAETFRFVQPDVVFKAFKQDRRTKMKYGDTALRWVLKCIRNNFTRERLVLNCMQRMSGIHTLYNKNTYINSKVLKRGY